MLIAFTKFVQTTDPDIITGYNIEGYDFYFILERAKILNIENEVNKLARCTTSSCECRLQKNVGSAQRGFQDIRTTRIGGRVVMDAMVVIKEFYKLPQYSLRYLLFHYHCLNFDFQFLLCLKFLVMIELFYVA